MNKKLKSNKGFTLIEILIVMSIIGLLSSATLIGLGTFRGAGKDTRRVADLRQIQNGLELHYAKLGTYPDALSDLTTAGIGIRSIPEDPRGGTYSYSNSCTDAEYALGAILDETNTDAKIFNDSAIVECASGSLTCTGATNMYCIAF
jgi:prepilin-type N-terminal cleavage/methylation domain-containing protein